MKKVLWLLIWFWLLFASCNADFLTVYNTNINSWNINRFPNNANWIALLSVSQSSWWMYCLEVSNVNYDSLTNQLNTFMLVNYSENFTIDDIDVHNYNISYKSFYYATWDSKYINCFYLPWWDIKIWFQTAVKSNIINWNVSFDLKIYYNSDNIFVNNCPTCTPQYTSEECQTEYWLVESWALTSCQTDLNSCITNTSWFNDLLNNCSNNLNACNLSLSSCLQSNCPTNTWDVSWSAFYVNDQQIFWGANIYLSIPDWLNWSYNYLDSDLFVDVVNEGDPDYIEDILDVQSYHPSSEDFTVSFVWFLTLILPYVVVALFCIFVFKIVKKIFK